MNLGFANKTLDKRNSYYQSSSRYGDREKTIPKLFSLVTLGILFFPAAAALKPQAKSKETLVSESLILRMYQVTPLQSYSCVNPAYNMSSPFTAPCSLGDFFINQYDPIENGIKIGDFKNSWHFTVASEAYKKAVEKKKIYAKEKQIRDAIVKVVLDTANVYGITIPKEWEDYFYKITIPLLPAKFLALEFGVCADAAQSAIVDSLKQQLKWKYRENIGLIMMGDHVFAISNAKNIHSLSREINDLDEFFQLLKQLEPSNLNRPIAYCDSWADSHAQIEQLVPHLQKKILASSQPLNQKQKLNVIDFSLPSFRKERNESNPQFRRFVKNALLWIFDIFSDAKNLEQINPDHVGLVAKKLTV